MADRPGVSYLAQRQAECPYPEGHEAHMSMNGECPHCGLYNPAQSSFGWIGEDGTIYSADGDVIQHGEGAW
jgi:hypothetical protein